MKTSTNTRRLGRGIICVFTLAFVATLALGQGNLVVSGSGSFSGSGVINVKGNINTSGASAAVAIPGTVNLSGTDTTQHLGVSGANAITFATLNATGSVGKKMDVNVTVSDALTVNITGALNLDVDNRTLTLGGTSTLTTGSLNVGNPGSTVAYDAAGAQSILGLTYVGAVTLSGAGAKNLAGAASVAGAFSQIGGDLTVNHNLTISGAAPSITTLADVTGTSTLAFSGTGAKSIGTVTTVSSGNAISNTGASGLLTVTNLAGNAGTIDGGAGGVTFANAATNSGNITGGAGAVTFGSTLAHSAGTITAGSGGVTFNGVPTISSGVVTAGDGANLAFNADIANSGTISLTGTGTASISHDFTSVGTLSFAGGSTVTFSGAAQNIPGATYGNLTAGGTGTKTAVGAITVAGNLVLDRDIDVYTNSHSLTFSNPGTVTGSYEVIGAVQRTHQLNAGTTYAFNRPEVTMRFASNDLAPVTITMRPGVAPDGVGASYVNRYYGVSSTADLSTNNANLQLYYTNAEKVGNLNETKYGLNKYNGSVLSKLGTSAGGTYTRDTVANTIALSNINQGLGGITQFAITPIGFFTIASGAWNAVATWGSTSDDVPTATDEATIMAGHAITVPAVSTIDSLTIAATGSLAVDGNTFNARTIANSGAITVASTHTLALTGAFANLTGSSIDITGIGSLMAVTNNGGFTIQNGGAANLGGAFVNNQALTTVGTGALTITGFDLTNAGTITNNGSITVQ
jgi:fibronectin-binding autotransporter adhesin